MGEPQHTADGRYVVIDGRRWRATDPAIPEDRRAELTRALMAWRREVRRAKGTDEEPAARAGVQAAKVALGERGAPWWEQSDEERRERWSAEVPVPQSRSQPRSQSRSQSRSQPELQPQPRDDG